MNAKSIFSIVAGILIGAAAALGLHGLAAPYKFQGAVINPPYAADDFSLTDQSGQPFQLSSQRGKVTLLFFGYSHCADVCPATLAEFKQIRQNLGSQADQAAFIFITVDPERDTPATLNTYLAKFDPSFIGLTGSLDQLTPVWKAYGVYQQDLSPSSLDAAVDHSSYIYVIDKAGMVRETFSYGDNMEGMAADVRALLKSRG